MSMELRTAGLYVVTLTNDEPISVNADRPSIADRCIKVHRAHCKFGKALDLHARRNNYQKTFSGYARFHPIAAVHPPEPVETLVGMELEQFRVRGLTGLPNEWLLGVTPEQVESVILMALEQARLPYRILGRVEA